MSATTETESTLDRGLLLTIYETVAKIRAFDDKAKALISGAQAFFVHYPVRGHEIISAAVSAAIEPDDYMTVTYRGVADEIAKGRLHPVSVDFQLEPLRFTVTYPRAPSGPLIEAATELAREVAAKYQEF